MERGLGPVLLVDLLSGRETGCMYKYRDTATLVSFVLRLACSSRVFEYLYRMYQVE